MYNFIFWFFYRFFEWRKGFQSVFLSSAMAGLAMLMHLLLGYCLLRYFGLIPISTFTETYTQRKLIILPFVLIFFVILYYGYYKNHAHNILEKRPREKFSRPVNILYMTLILVVPLLIAIRLTNLIFAK
jgi:hypothetical protein